MISLQTLSALLGWSLVINLIVLTLSALLLITLRRPLARIHSALFGLDGKDVGRAYFYYLALYKIAIFAFNFAPWLALKIIA